MALDALRHTRQLAAILLFFAATAVRGDGARTIQLRSPAGGEARCSGRVLISRACPSGKCTEPTEHLEFHSDAAVVVREDPGRPTSRIEFESRNCWIAPINNPAPAAALQTTAWPLAMVEGTLALADGGTSHELRAFVRVEGLDDEVSAQCKVTSRKWECPIPAARVAVRLSVPGYAPRHIWSIQGKAGEAIRAGAVEFRRGATITGSLRGPSRLLPANIQLDLFNDGRELTEPYGRTRASNDKFEFTGLPPGAYRVTARSKGLSPAESQRVMVSSEPLYDTGVLRLRELGALRGLVNPPTDDAQRPWHVIIDRVSPRSMYTTHVADEPVQADGWWERRGLEAGVYAIAVGDATGAIFDRRRVTVEETTTLVEVHLSQIPVRGRLVVGSNGMPADLAFTSTGLNSGKRVSTKSNDEGFFSTVLPTEGSWNVQIKPAGRLAYVIRRGIDVHQRDDLPYVEIDLGLPSGTVKGIVVDGDGNPLRKGLNVMLFRDGRPEADAGSDANGEFEFFGLADGNVMLQAKSRSVGDSGLVPVEVKGEADSTTKLVVTSARTVKGVLVTSDGSPVAGAVVRFVSPSTPGFGETVAGPGGTFELSVPDQTETITIAVLSIGMPVHLALLGRSDDDQPQQVTLAPTAGELLVHMTAASRMPAIGLPGGTMLGMSALIFPPDGSSAMPPGIGRDGFDIALTPGLYLVCPQANACESITIRQGESTTVKSVPLVATDSRPGK